MSTFSMSYQEQKGRGEEIYNFAIDTGFIEAMTLPPDIIDELNLPT